MPTPRDLPERACGRPSSRPASPTALKTAPHSQAAILDLVTAAVTEDLLEASAVRLLRDDGQAILDLPTLVTEPGSGDGTAGNAVVNAYRDSPTSRRVLNGIGALALAGLVFLIVAGATEELMLALSLALGVVVLLLLSVYGPGWWERRGQSGERAPYVTAPRPRGGSRSRSRRSARCGGRWLRRA